MPKSSSLKVTQKTRREKVSTVYLAISNQIGGAEEVFTIVGPRGVMLPLVALSERELPNLKRYSQEAANESGKQVTIVGFTSRAVYETFAPVSTRN